jgi:hypothetical protein
MRFREYFRDIFSEPTDSEAIPLAKRETKYVGRIIAKPNPKGVRLAAVRSAPSREEFAAWRDHPVTQFVFVALNAAAGEQRKAWDETSWEGGSADENLLLELRVRADAYNSMQEADYEGFCEWAGVEPEPVEQGAWAS